MCKICIGLVMQRLQHKHLGSWPMNTVKAETKLKPSLSYMSRRCMACLYLIGNEGMEKNMGSYLWFRA